MFIDSRELSGDPTLECDVCIVGAGAAGITFAREFVDTQRSVILLESGGLEFDRPTQSLYRGESTGNVFASASQYLVRSRLRFFGGSTNHWAGYSRPLEDLDFEERPWIPDSGWPISAADLRDYYRRALPILALPSFDYDADQDFSPSRAPIGFAPDSAFRTAMIHFSSPTNFGSEYREELANAQNIRVLLHGNAVELATNSNGTLISRLRARCLSGTGYSIAAKKFVLATGGIENPRLLLLSRATHPQGIGNQHDLVGRYFMEHLAMTGGEVVATLPANALTLYERKKDPLRDHVSLGLFMTTAKAQRERSLHGFTARIMPFRGGGRNRDRRNFVQAVTRFDHLADTSEVKKGSVDGRLRVVSEQVPNAASRVTLSEQRDQLGLNRVHLDWRVQSSDYLSVHNSLRLLGTELGRASRGRVRLGVRYAEGDLAPRNDGGNHHMGTTRMHVSPKHGVVDSDCRLHGVSNLFVAGSSVFPTGGAEGTTTVTIVALALRLADQLKKELAS